MVGILHVLPRPVVSFHGSATEEEAQPFIDLIELSQDDSHYFVLVSVPKALTFPHGFNALSLNITPDGDVCIEGQTSPGSIFLNPAKVCKTRIQLCPVEPWGISFSLPGPVDLSENRNITRWGRTMKFRVRKEL